MLCLGVIRKFPSPTRIHKDATDAFQGFARPQHSNQRSPYILDHCLWSRMHPFGLQRSISQHPNNWQFRPTGLLYHLHRLPILPPQLRPPIRESSTTSPILPRHDRREHHQRHCDLFPRLLRGLGHVSTSTESNGHHGELESIGTGWHGYCGPILLHLAAQVVPRGWHGRQCFRNA